ncbi:T9SS type A sorting domain-containing protein [Hymenobacter sp. ASUV-10]|uniref:T9SS type A sorting domain-containing protein n=1 Tax=Hymenobacter aranciens TaxID=3063996 RepID=A0ABT9BBF2_9BACT|nr:T9SS type A sorting domain-containing protein [Hymenobacter sp. ASUV-10]MDO7875600.1 T9SS type A sorting domain-containing protein [Hymenobacter sp. ASUV-10]
MMTFYRCFLRLAGLVGLVVLLVLPALPGRAQLATWQPSVLIESVGNGNSHITAVAPAPNGDLYVAGNVSGSARLGNRNYSSTGGSDGFVARYQPGTNTVVWLLPLTGTTDEQVAQLVVSGSSLYLTGQFSSSSLTVGSRTLANTYVPGSSTFDGFALKLTDEGLQARTEWLYQLGGPENESVSALAVAGITVYLGGHFSSPALNLGAAAVLSNPTSLSTNPTTNGFVLALEDAGTAATLRWALPVGGDGLEDVKVLAVSGPTVYVGGEYSPLGNSVATFGTLPLPVSGSLHGYVGKITDGGTQGVAQWVEPLSNGQFTNLYALAASGSTVYVGGTYYGTAFALGPDVLPYLSRSEIYVAQLNDAGAQPYWAWARAAAGAGYDHVYALAADAQGVYLAGQFNSPTLAFGPVTLSNSSTVPGSTDDLFISYLSAGGTFGATQQVGGPGNAALGALTLANGLLHVGGSFNEVATFGTQSYTAPNGGYTSFAGTVAARVLGTASATALPGLTLAPNPAHGRAALHLPAGTGATPFIISILDGLGRVMQRREVAATASGQTTPLELAGLAPGVYAVRVQQGPAQAVQRLVVE